MKQLLFSVKIKDCIVDTFRAGGKGGQNQNKRDTGVRVRHPPSGAIGESRTYRGQLENKRSAFRKMAQQEKFQTWVRLQAAGRPSIDELVDMQMQKENLKIEEKRGDRMIETQ